MLKKIFIKIIPKSLKVLIKKIVQRLIDIQVRYNFIKSISPKKINALKSSKKNHKKCFIIGSGPSIGNQNLNLLLNHFTIVHNTFYSINKNYDFHPSLYVVEDILVAEDNKEELNKIFDVDLIVPYRLKNFIKPRKNVNYINFDYSYLDSAKDNDHESLDFKFSNNIQDKAYWGGTVVYLSMQIAYYLGFKEIYLLGVDLSYSIPKSAKIEGNVITSTEDNSNHVGDMYGKGKKWHLPKTDRMKSAIEFATEFLISNGVKVYNCSPKSTIKGAKNINFNEIFLD